MLIPTIKSCLNNIPKNRASIFQVCSQLEGLVDKQYSSTDETDMPSSSLQQDIKKKDAEIRKKDDEIRKKDDEILKRDAEIQSKDIEIQYQATEIEALKADIAKLQQRLKSHDPALPKAALLSRQVYSYSYLNSYHLASRLCLRRQFS